MNKNHIIVIRVLSIVFFESLQIIRSQNFPLLFCLFSCENRCENRCETNPGWIRSERLLPVSQICYATPQSINCLFISSGHENKKLKKIKSDLKKSLQPSIESSTGSFSVIKELGRGGFGVVQLVEQVTGERKGERFALKQTPAKSYATRIAIEEARMMKLFVGSPNVIQLFDSFSHGNKTNLLMEHATYGDLNDVKKRIKNLPIPCIDYIVESILKGLQALHTIDVVHRDMKLENIFVIESGVVKVGDLGLAEKLPKGLKLTSYAGTEGYAAPEVTQYLTENFSWKKNISKGYDTRADLFSFGVMLHELMSEPRKAEYVLKDGRQLSKAGDCNGDCNLHLAGIPSQEYQKFIGNLTLFHDRCRQRAIGGSIEYLLKSKQFDQHFTASSSNFMSLLEDGDGNEKNKTKSSSED